MDAITLVENNDTYYHQMINVACKNLKFKSKANNKSKSNTACLNVLDNMPEVFLTLAREWRNFQNFITRHYRCRTIRPHGGEVQCSESHIYQVQFLVWLCKYVLLKKRPSERRLCAVSLSLQMQRHDAEIMPDQIRSVLAMGRDEPNAFIRHFSEIPIELLYVHGMV